MEIRELIDLLLKIDLNEPPQNKLKSELLAKRAKQAHEQGKFGEALAYRLRELLFCACGTWETGEEYRNLCMETVCHLQTFLAMGGEIRCVRKKESSGKIIGEDHAD